MTDGSAAEAPEHDAPPTPPQRTPPRARWAVAALLAAAWLVLAGPIFFGRSYWFRDQGQYFQPMRLYLRERLLRGEIPLWNPHFGLGRPFFSLIQPAILDPLNALLLLPAPFGSDLFNAAHLLIAAVGTLVWQRARGLGLAASTLGATVFAFGGAYASNVVSLGNYAWGAAWVPWSLAVLAVAARQEAPPRRVINGLLVGVTLTEMLLSGSPLAVWFTVLFGAAQALGEDAPAARRRALVTLAAGGVVALGLGAALLVPGAMLAREIRSGGVGAAEAGIFSVHPARMLELLAANPWGSVYLRASGMSHLVTAREHTPLIVGQYAGALTLPLAAVALARGGRFERAMGLAALLAATLSLGRFTPLWSVWHAAVLPARMFRHPEHHLTLLSLALAALAASGFERLSAAPERLRRVALLGAGVTLACAALSAAVGPSWAQLPSAFARSAGWLVVIAGVAHLARLRPAVSAAAVVVACAVDVTSAGVALQTWAPSRIYQETPPIVALLRGASQPSRRALRVLRPVELTVFSGEPDPVELWAALQPDIGTWDGVIHLAPYDVSDDLLLAPLLRGPYPDPVLLWRLVGADFVVHETSALRGAPTPWIVGEFPRFGLTALRPPAPAEPAFLAFRTRPARTTDEAAAWVRRGRFDPAREAVIEGGTSTIAHGRCEITDDRVDAMDLRCTSDAPAWLVVVGRWDRGWRATVNGVDAPVHRANVSLRAVRVGPGESAVSLRYTPPGLRVGAVVSALSLVAALAAYARARAALRARRASGS